MSLEAGPESQQPPETVRQRGRIVSFLTLVGGLLAGIAAILTAVATIIGLLGQRQPDPPPSADAQPPTSTAVPTSSPPRTELTCYWKVIWWEAGVYEEPYRDLVHNLVKRKHEDDIVGGPCESPILNSSEGRDYVKVHSTDAKDGVGWVILDAVEPEPYQKVRNGFR